MQENNYPIALPCATSATPKHKRRRFRGWIYVAMHGPENDVRGLTVCTDYARACMALGGWRDDEGDILLIAPGEGARVRTFIAGGASPFSTQRINVCTENAAAEISRSARCSAQHARDVIGRVLAEYPDSAGWHLYRHRSAVADAYGAPL